MPSGLQSDGQWFCKPCDLVLDTCEALLEHKQQMRRDGHPKHIHCKHCGMDFKTEKAEMVHVHQFHPMEQKLVCSACGKGPFVRLGGLMAHIEQGQCAMLDTSAIDERRERNTDFSRRLEAMTQEPIKNSFARYMGSSQASGDLPTGATGSETWWPSKASEPKPETTLCSQATLDQLAGLDLDEKVGDSGRKPMLGHGLGKTMVRMEKTPSSETDLASGSRKDTARKWPHQRASCVADVKKEESLLTDSLANGGNEDKKPIPSDDTSQPPGVEQVDQHQKEASMGSEFFGSMDADHPDHASFSSARYYSPFAQAFVCPKLPCGKVFQTAGGLISHLRSTAHGSRTYQCPYCLHKFKSLRAIVSHAEQSSVRCSIRESGNYDAFIHQLTAGIANVGGERHEDGTIKYQTAEFW